MSIDMAERHLALRLEAPLQSWGSESSYNIRRTESLPTKSALAGICCAAIGIERGTEDEQEFLKGFSTLKMLSMSIPKKVDGRELETWRLQDFHTVRNSKTAEGGEKKSHITKREYLTDASFGAVLTGDATLIERISAGLEDPKWGIWLGRKSCIPSAPVFAGVFASETEAVAKLTGGKAKEEFTRQEDASSFAEGNGTLQDSAIAFGSGMEQRTFKPRRVNLTQGRQAAGLN